MLARRGQCCLTVESGLAHPPTSSDLAAFGQTGASIFASLGEVGVSCWHLSSLNLGIRIPHSDLHPPLEPAPLPAPLATGGERTSIPALGRECRDYGGQGVWGRRRGGGMSPVPMAQAEACSASLSPEPREIGGKGHSEPF